MEEAPQEKSISTQIGEIDAQISMVDIKMIKLEEAKEKGTIKYGDYIKIQRNFFEDKEELLRKRAKITGEKIGETPEWH